MIYIYNDVYVSGLKWFSTGEEKSLPIKARIDFKQVKSCLQQIITNIKER